MCSERRLPTSSTRSHTNRRKFNPFGDALVLSVAFRRRSAGTFDSVLPLCEYEFSFCMSVFPACRTLDLIPDTVVALELRSVRLCR